MNTAPSFGSSPSLLSRLGRGLLRIVLALFALLMLAAAMLFGLMMAVAVVLWALLRGRRPGPMSFRWQTVRRPGAFRREAAGEVIDVQAREVSEPPGR